MRSLGRIRDFILVSIVCKAAPISSSGPLNGLNELPEVRFEFPFIILISKSTMNSFF